MSIFFKTVKIKCLPCECKGMKISFVLSINGIHHSDILTNGFEGKIRKLRYLHKKNGKMEIK